MGSVSKKVYWVPALTVSVLYVQSWDAAAKAGSDPTKTWVSLALGTAFGGGTKDVFTRMDDVQVSGGPSAWRRADAPSVHPVFGKYAHTNTKNMMFSVLLGHGAAHTMSQVEVSETNNELRYLVALSALLPLQDEYKKIT